MAYKSRPFLRYMEREQRRRETVSKEGHRRLKLNRVGRKAVSGEIQSRLRGPSPEKSAYRNVRFFSPDSTRITLLRVHLQDHQKGNRMKAIGRDRRDTLRHRK